MVVVVVVVVFAFILLPSPLGEGHGGEAAEGSGGEAADGHGGEAPFFISHCKDTTFLHTLQIFGDPCGSNSVKTAV